MRHITLVLEYFHPWPNSAGFYLARDNGWFADQGIDLEIRCVDPGRGDSLEYLARGQADFAVFPSNRLLVRREAGQPLVAIAAINQRGLETVRTRADSGIRRLRDLEGRRLALNPTPRGRAIVRSLVAADGGDPDRVVLVDAGARELDPATGFDGLADATFGSYWAWDVLLTSFPAHSERVWRVDDELGLSYHSYLLGIREDDSINPELVRGFLEASERGYRAAEADRAAAAAVYDRVTPYFRAEVIRRSVDEIAPTWFHDGGWGSVRAELTEPYSRWLAEQGILADAEVWRAAIAADARVA